MFIISSFLDKLRLHDSGVLAIEHPDRQMIWKNGAAQEIYCMV